MSELTIREYQPGDERAILDTFNLVFREVCGAGYVDRQLPRWIWQYLHNPAGRRMMLAVAADGRVACQYAGVPVRVHSPDGDVVFDHAVDSMVHPEFRRGLKKEGVFVPTANRFFSRWGFAGEDAIVFGYPVDAPWRIGERYFEQKLIRVLDYLIRPAAAGSDAEVRDITVREVARFGPAADALWAAARPSLRCAVVRDGSYLDWRYPACPDVRYVCLLATRGQVPCGLAVLQPAHEVVPEACTFADWLVPGDDADTGRALLAAATRLMRARGRKCLMAVANEALGWARFLVQEGFVPTPSATWMVRRLGCRTFAPRFTADWLRDNWHYTLGDSDLV
jgi:hypothetical protein